MVFALYHFIGIVHHIVPQVIEAKFVVGTIGDVGQVSLSSFWAVGGVLIDAVYG